MTEKQVVRMLVSALEKTLRKCNCSWLSLSRLGMEASCSQTMTKKFFWSSLQA